MAAEVGSHTVSFNIHARVQLSALQHDTVLLCFADLPCKVGTPM